MDSEVWGEAVIYLLILLGLLACMALIDARFKLFIFAKPLAALLSLILGTAFFLLWDVLAISQGIFLHRDSPLMTGIMVAEQLPLEEVFFLIFLCYSTMVVVTGLPVVRRALRRNQARTTGGHNVS
ncbi:lycopene cyclase domain-containing protein [Glutamicibacter ardleyensis]|uniref:lycopene cyclase domain-containing protein n=1 Tax=Glutamicibacter ardleyensis TaxID=225894 RepID=UPI003FD530DE